MTQRRQQQQQQGHSRSPDALSKFIVADCEETGKEFGRGSYGAVLEVLVKGQRYAAKKLHTELLDVLTPEIRKDVISKFERECIRLSTTRHPNIVQFIGVSYPEGSQIPLLVMEYLPLTLAKFLDDYSNVAPDIKNGILTDVACGLRYLHEQSDPVIHRDLNPVNILLRGDLKAKIADFGVARILDSNNPALTSMPGNCGFMPPEARFTNPKYTTKLDIFSFGIVVVHVVIQAWPTPQTAVCEKSIDGTTRLLSEVERRSGYFDMIEDTNPLKALARNCLHENPDLRPTAANLIDELGRLAQPTVERNYIDVLHALSAKDEEIEQLKPCRQQLNELKDTFQRILEEMAAKDMEIEALKKELKGCNEQLEGKRITVEALEKQLDLKKTTAAHAVEKVPHILNPAFEVTWKKIHSLPHPRKHAHVVFLNGTVYAGGGFSDTEKYDLIVYKCDVRTFRWEVLPQSPVRWFGMGTYKEQLVLVGGKEGPEAVGRVTVWMEGARKWEQHTSVPDLPAPRMCSSVLGHRDLLIVAGGWNAGRFRLDTVEVYSAATKTWCAASPLPRRCADMKSYMSIEGVWYLMGGSNQYKAVYCVSLESVVSSVTEQDSKPMKWKSISDAPREMSSIAQLGGAIVAIGGKSSKSPLMAYVPHTSTWVEIGKVGTIPESISKSCSLSLPDGGVLVVGGSTKSADAICSVYKVTLEAKGASAGDGTVLSTSV